MTWATRDSERRIDVMVLVVDTDKRPLAPCHRPTSGGGNGWTHQVESDATGPIEDALARCRLRGSKYTRTPARRGYRATGDRSDGST
jgi:hypothetical protein